METKAKKPDAKSASASAAPADRQVERVLIHGRTDDGGLKILRRRRDRLEAGVAQPLRQGQPIHGEVVRLHPHKDFPLLCDVEAVDLKATNEPPKVSTKGPAKVTSPAYRQNWGTIFGGNRTSNALPN